jgi:hypothetical protein
MNTAEQTAHSFTPPLPPILDVAGLDANFSIGKTTAYHLASAGEIQSLTVGAPGRRGRRVFLTESVVAYISRRLGASTPLNCHKQAPDKGAASAPVQKAPRAKRRKSDPQPGDRD